MATENHTPNPAVFRQNELAQRAERAARGVEGISTVLHEMLMASECEPGQPDWWGHDVVSQLLQGAESLAVLVQESAEEIQTRNERLLKVEG